MAIGCGLVVVGLATTAWAGGSCLRPMFGSRGTLVDTYGGSELPETAFPVDATPWLVEVYPPGAGDDCALVSDLDVIPVVATTVGAEDCEDFDFARIHRYTPESPSKPGQDYELVCDGEPTGYHMRTRQNPAPSADPGQLAITSAQHIQEDGGCCGVGDTLELHVEGFDGGFLNEGGYVEVVYPDGCAAALKSYPGGVIELPVADGTIEFTPVAADGTRGETVRLTEHDIHTEAVYIPCAVDRRAGWRSLWLLVPLLWIRPWSRRRRPF